MAPVAAAAFNWIPLAGVAGVLFLLFVMTVVILVVVGLVLRGRGKKVAKSKQKVSADVLDDPYNSPIVDLVESIRVRKTHERGKELLEEMAEKMYPGLQGKSNAGSEAKP